MIKPVLHIHTVQIPPDTGTSHTGDCSCSLPVHQSYLSVDTGLIACAGEGVTMVTGGWGELLEKGREVVLELWIVGGEGVAGVAGQGGCEG